YALIGGFVSLLSFTLQGAIFLTLRTTDFIYEGARRIVNALWIPVALLAVILVVFTNYETDLFAAAGARAAIPLIGAPIAIIAAGYLFRLRREGWAFTVNSLAILLFVAALFLGLYPRVMVSSLDPAWSLTVANTASGATTLRTMSIIALIFVPIVLAYQGWSYWIFRKRIVEKKEALHY
ncbi:MAG: cytochrome d ubiquinol oxidase subunit II, partial [Anaerolineaceae bacterium]